MRKILAYYLKPYYGRMALGFGIKFTGTVMDLLLPWTLAHMIDQVIPTGRQGEILMWGGFMVVCSVLAVVFNIMANRMASRVASDVIYTVRGDLFAKVMYLSHEEGDRITRPSLISRLTSDTYYVHQMLARVQRLGVRAPILLLGGLAMTLILDPVLACVLLAVMPLLAVVVVVVSRKGIPLFAALQDCADRFVRLVREDIAGIRVIKALSKEDYERARCDSVNREMADAELKATMTTAVSNPAMNIFLNLGLVGVIVAGAYRVNAGTSQVGKILAFMTYFTIILNAMMSISRMFVMISKAAASAGRIDQVLVSRDERELLGVLEEDAVSQSSGDNEVPHVEFDLRQLRSRFGAVFQNDVIFENTILENITMGRALGREQAGHAVRHAMAEEFVTEKGGLGQQLDIRGANLSGGQKQRLLIARALAGNPEILILDDSSSALDYKTDAALRQELREHFRRTTCIVIAQRVSSVMSADHILVLEEGQAIGYGTHEQLMASCSVYREISSSQMGA